MYKEGGGNVLGGGWKCKVERDGAKSIEEASDWWF